MTPVVDRNVLAGRLVEAVDHLFTEGGPNPDMTEWMTGLCAGHLLLLWNLKEAWQGFPSEEDSQAAQKIADTIAAAFGRRR